ncbi:MAG: porphobilinogen synthase [Alphaproteobacteria bacterium]|nr:porphobilinogen synthase [Alphaproteobacteria bacterium]OJV11947.1 MAG: delta-aminolevulinic acid dehydratase [Alphaproteobacteria bacterium 33-17]
MDFFIQSRQRRLRRNEAIRALVQESFIREADLILPLFIIEGDSIRQEIPSMPGVFRLSINEALSVVNEAMLLGIRSFALFPCIDSSLKDADGSEAMNSNNLICRAVREIKRRYSDAFIICDVALDPYTTHGHDGVLGVDGDVDNDATIEILANQALILANSGCDAVAPSDMMDGRIGYIRTVLDSSGFENTIIIAYAAKYASSFYGAFRDAVGSKSLLGIADKKTYQMNPANSIEALREVASDVAEGADIVLIKPGLHYLDIILQTKLEFDVPVFAYHVSGEYSMLKFAEEKGVLDYNKAIMETMLCFKRAGASGIFTYAAIDVARIIRGLV